MRKTLLASAALLLAAAGSAAAQTSASLADASNNVTFTVSAVDQLSFGEGVSFQLSTLTGGQFEDSKSTTYGITTNGVNRSIEATITEGALPSGAKLFVRLDAPNQAAQSTGEVELQTLSAATVVTGISNVSAPTVPVTYRLTADSQAAVDTYAVVVTYTVIESGI